MKVAIVQLNAGTNKQLNVRKALEFVSRAAARRAGFILLPEIFNYRGVLDTAADRHDVAEDIPGDSTRPFMDLARRHRVNILLGSLYERIPGKGKIYNTSVLIDPEGMIKAKYRKINLFDAVLGRKVFKESRNFAAGKKFVCASVNEFMVGLSICYDVRFPVLYQRCAGRGAQILTVPSSFTKPTGQAHWEVLLRARAIENLSYVLAPNQVGRDSRGVPSYGNSLIIDPWGKVLARASADREEIIYADVNRIKVNEARKILPRWQTNMKEASDG